MHLNDFLKLNLKLSDYIWIQNEKGNGFNGNYAGYFDLNEQTFRFRNHSTGATDLVEIKKLQRIIIHERA